MDAIETLKDEHRLIERVLGCLEHVAAHAREHQRVETAPARDALRILSNYADQYHHAKEEEALFPMLEQEEAFSPGCGPTAVLRSEHEQARLHLRSMREALTAAAEGDSRFVDRFVEHAKANLALLRAHIRKEEHCLFPDAEAHLTPRDHWELIEAYRRIEGRMDFESRERMIMAAHLLADRLGVPLVPEAGGAGCGCRSGGGSTARRETVPRGGGGTRDDEKHDERPFLPAGF